ncbi:MAG: ATP-binding protein [Chloroflexi bacterium]|nr:ATP-binding protein [Chloroflexota bacterium]
MNLPLANYQDEQAQFQKLLEPTSTQRILMFHGESGSGKSRLLEWCVEQVPTHMRYLSVQLRGSDTNAAHILYRLGRSIGWERLNTFTQHIAHLLQTPEANGQRTFPEMRRHLSGLLQKAEPSLRKQHRASVTDAWFADVTTFRSPLLLILDTYEKRTTELDQWFSQQFLPWVADTSAMRVLVAGQNVPEQSSDWRHCCSIHQLQGVHDAQAWLPIARAMGRDVASLEYLAGACAMAKGNPSQIVEFIKLLPKTAQPTKPEQRIANKRVRWRKNMNENFELIDIRELCYDFSIDYENLGGSGILREKVMGLITFMEKRGRLDELIDRCRELRPRLEW